MAKKEKWAYDPERLKREKIAEHAVVKIGKINHY